MQPLRFVTNSSSFDFPTYEGGPVCKYVLASTPRCGSNFLQRALWRTGVAGAPEEYLTRPYLDDFVTRFPRELSSSATSGNLERYLRVLWRLRTSANGVFGLKLHGSHLAWAFQDDGDLLPGLRDSRWIWMRRRNTIAQAVSYLLADQTGVWIVDGEWLPLSPPTGTPSYDEREITKRLVQIESEERLWQDLFDGPSQPPPLVVEYEELVSNYESTISGVLAFLDVPTTGDVHAAGVRKQATDLNRDWEVRYRKSMGLKRAMQ